MKTHIAYPGHVTSRTYFQRHYIGFRKLCELHGIDPAVCVDGSREEARGIDASALVPIRPLFSGKYPAILNETKPD